MWTRNVTVPVPKESNNNICASSLLSSLVDVTGDLSQEEHSNSSSLESIDSPLLGDNRALSTSCSEDSFEMSSTASRTACDLLTPSDCSHTRQDVTSDEFTSILESAEELQTTSCESSKSDSIQPNNQKVCCDTAKDEETSHDQDMGIQNECSKEKDDHICLPSTSKEGDEQLLSRTMGSTDGESNWVHGPTTSRSMNSIATTSRSTREAVRESIDKELSGLDTHLPELDFNKLEEQLNCAAKERQIIERKLLGEQVRRRLALQVDQLTAGPSPRVYMRPSKSNFGYRLQTAMNLQICYMNDLEDDEDEGDFDSSDDELGVPKSKSAPNLHGHVPDGSNMNATQLRQQVAASCDCKHKRSLLEEETKMMLIKAKQTAKMQMELEKLNGPRAAVPLTRKVTRIQLSKMSCRQLTDILDKLSRRIDEENAELMRLLVERDSLHMEQDSMLVDIEDMIQHESNSESLNLPDFLKVQANTSSAPSKFRLFKR